MDQILGMVSADDVVLAVIGRVGFARRYTCCHFPLRRAWCFVSLDRLEPMHMEGCIIVEAASAGIAGAFTFG